MRNTITEIIPGKLYQRGKILTWQKDKKDVILGDLGVNMVVNFWPKLDVNLEDMWVLHLATNESVRMMEADIDIMAETVSMLLDAGKCALILCEAGKTRSVYFTVLIVSYFLGLDLPDALAYVEARLPNHSLKNFMLEFINYQYCDI